MGIFDDTLNNKIQSMKPTEWTPDFCVQVYEEVAKNNNKYKCFPIYYPVGNGFFNTPKAIEDLKFISQL